MEAEPSPLERRAREAYERGDFAGAAASFERALAREPSNRELAFQLARAWARNEQVHEAEDLLGDLLLEDANGFRNRIDAETAFDSDGVARLLRTGGVSALPLGEVPHAVFDIDADGTDETFAVSHRSTRQERFLAVIVQTPAGPSARRLVDVQLLDPRVTAFRTTERGAAVLLEQLGNTTEAELHLVSGATRGELQVVYGKRFVQDGGDAEDAPTADGALWFSVIDVVPGGEPELVLTLIDPHGEPGKTEVLELDGAGVTELGPAEGLRKRAAERLRTGEQVLSRATAEALVRLEPPSSPARLALLTAPDRASSAEWWGFYPPGANNFIALHAVFFARHTDSAAHAALAKVPAVAAFLARWSLTPDQLAAESQPLVPPSSLWGRAHFVETPETSTAFSYFRLR